MPLPATQPSAAECICPQEDLERPQTPENIKSFRQSYRKQPGLRFIHSGLLDAEPPSPGHRFGVQTDAGERVNDCLTTVQQRQTNMFELQKESHYHSHKREPLGRSYVRGHSFPKECEEEDFRFGLKVSDSGTTARKLIYQEEKGHTMPSKKNLESWESVSKQLDRQYDWDKAKVAKTHRFGKKVGADPGGQGVRSVLHANQSKTTAIAPIRVIALRKSTKNPLGHCPATTVDVGPEFRFGHRVRRDQWGAGKCIQGEYSEVGQQPDTDLGISRLRLSGALQLDNVNPGRRFGVPSIRSDVAKPNFRSVANATNYGDETDAKGLLYPSRFSFDGVEASEWSEETAPVELRSIFEAIGATFNDEEFETLCNAAEKRYGVLCVDSFRHVWNAQQQLTLSS